MLQRRFPADRPIQHVQSDLANNFGCFSTALPMEELDFRLRHTRVQGEIRVEYPTEVERAQLAGEPGVKPVMAIFLSSRVLLLRDDVARKGPLQRAIPHGDLPGVAAFHVGAGATFAFRCRQRALLDSYA